MQSRIVGKKRTDKKQLSKELMYGTFKRSVNKKLANTRDADSVEQANIRRPRVRAEDSHQSKHIQKERIREMIAPFVRADASRCKVQPEQKRSKHSAHKQSRSGSQIERLKSQTSKTLNRIGLEGLSKEALEVSNGPAIKAIGEALSVTFAATASKAANKDRELLKPGIESAGPKFYKGELKERNLSTVAVRSESVHADFDDRGSINESDMPALTITNRSDLEALNKMINFNDKNPESNYSLAFDQVPHRRSREGQTLQLISPKIKCKRLSQRTDTAPQQPAAICETARDEGLKSVFSVKFVSDDKCEIFLPVDVDGIAVHDPSNPKSKKILTRQRTPFTKEKKASVPEWQGAIPSFKQMVTRMEDSRRIRLPPQTEAKLGSSNNEGFHSCSRDPPKPFTQSHQASVQDSRSHTPIKRDSHFDASEQKIFRPTHLLRRTDRDKDADAKSEQLPERVCIENSFRKEQARGIFFQKATVPIQLKSALKSESKRKFNLRNLYLEDHQMRPEVSHAIENQTHEAER
jgi:hypothetical protein